MMKNPAPSAPVMNCLRPLIVQLAVGSDRAGRQRRGVRPGPGCGLGHGERGADVAAGEWFEVALLLLWVGDVREHVHVALVGCGDVQRGRAEQRVPAGLEDDGAIDVASGPGRRSAARPAERAGPPPWPARSARRADRPSDRDSSSGCRARRGAPARARSGGRIAGAPAGRGLREKSIMGAPVMEVVRASAVDGSAQRQKLERPFLEGAVLRGAGSAVLPAPEEPDEHCNGPGTHGAASRRCRAPPPCRRAEPRHAGRSGWHDRHLGKVAHHPRILRLGCIAPERGHLEEKAGAGGQVPVDRGDALEGMRMTLELSSLNARGSRRAGRSPSARRRPPIGRQDVHGLRQPDPVRGFRRTHGRHRDPCRRTGRLAQQAVRRGAGGPVGGATWRARTRRAERNA